MTHEPGYPQRHSGAGERPYIGERSQDLIFRYFDSLASQAEGDPSIARELSVRLHEHGKVGMDPLTTPLRNREGKKIYGGDKRELMGVDYVQYAAGHHDYALPKILGFLLTSPGEPEYENGRAAIQEQLGISRS